MRPPSTSTGTRACPEKAMASLVGEAPGHGLDLERFMSQRQLGAPAIRAEAQLRIGPGEIVEDARHDYLTTAAVCPNITFFSFSPIGLPACGLTLCTIS